VTLRKLSVTLDVNFNTSPATEGLELCRQQRVPWECECLELLDLWGARAEVVPLKGNSDTACEVTIFGIGGAWRSDRGSVYSRHIARGNSPPEILTSPRKSGMVNFQRGLEITEEWNGKCPSTVVHSAVQATLLDMTN